MKKKTKKIIKYVVSIIVAVLGLGTVSFFINIELHKSNGNMIKVNQNNGVIIGENNGVVKNYTMGGGTSRTREINDKLEESIIEYKPSYVSNEDTIIKGNKLALEGVIIKSYSYQMQDVFFETLFGSDKFNIKFGADHPVGYKLNVYTEGGGYGLTIDTTICDTSLVDEWDNIQEGAMVQISPYDFDADGVNELIVCITNEVEGICSIFSYTHVDDISKINPFRQELCVPIQKNIVLDGNSLQVIIGTHGIVDKEYKYVDEQFMVITR
ncbi:MAG: hypothetical protein HFG28_13485 [Eubacterium sp.]|nr:hypothetical protein [Eubacterium sp.]